MTIGLTISVAGSAVRSLPDVPYKNGMNVQEAMEAAYSVGSGYSFRLRYFGNLGYEVVTIDEISSQTGSDISFYWELLINGYPATQGIDQTYLSDGDEVTFDYATYDAAKHASLRVGIIHSALTRS